MVKCSLGRRREGGGREGKEEEEKEEGKGEGRGGSTPAQGMHLLSECTPVNPCTELLTQGKPGVATGPTQLRFYPRGT